jgi:hypothetical protein
MSIAVVRPNQPLGRPILQRRRPGWLVEFASERPQHADPLTGWAGGNEPESQIRLSFPSKAAAVAHCAQQALQFTVQEEPPKKLLLQSYADNFR